MVQVFMNELYIKGLSLDSRTIKSGDLFVALSGNQQDGKHYIPDAINKGAVAVLVEPSTSAEKMKSAKVPVIEFSNLRNSVSAIAGRFFSDPSKQLSLIAITGTNGKTSCSHFIAQILENLNYPCGVMGTLGNGFLNDLKVLKQTTNTTIDPISTQEVLASLKEQGAKACAMEVTSHALTQGRVEGLAFKTAIFTNLTRDHLDYHQDMQSYFAAKKRLFTELKPKNIVINVDDTYGQALLEELCFSNKNASNNTSNTTSYNASYTNSDNKETNHKVIVIAYGTNPELISKLERKYLGNKLEPLWLVAKDLIFTEEGSKANIRTPWGEGELVCPLLGLFNLSNILASLAAVSLENIPLSQSLAKIKNLKSVTGRMTAVKNISKNTLKDPMVIIDYAHTPDALAQVLKALRLHCTGKLFCVFGCGGDRDKGKRKEMAAIAEMFSDKVVVTQDNPRTENPDAIIEDILQGFKEPKKIILEPNRREAIAFAIQNAQKEDFVLIAGKGHEDYQIIGNEKFPFSDLKEAEEALSRRIA